MAYPLLDIGDISRVLERVGGGRRTQRMQAQAVDVNPRPGKRDGMAHSNQNQSLWSRFASQATCCVPFLGLLCLASCSSARIDERYYVSGVRDGVVQNYYRIDITGQVCGTELRYLSGFFDEEALDRYFNTFTQPDGGALFTLDKVDDEEMEKRAPSEESRDADPRGLGRKLVILMSQNSEAIADQIGAISQSEGFATVVGRLVFKEQLAEIETARVDSNRLVQQADSAKVLASDLATRLTGDPAPGRESTKEQLLIFVNQVAGNLGAPRFSDWAAAQQWLQENQAKLIGGTE